MSTSTEPRTNFLGMPVTGDYNEGSKRAEQQPAEDLQPLLQAVLDDPTVVEFGWRQYTPYFNDGEPCTFSVHGVWVRTTDLPTDKDRDDDDEEFGPDDLEVWSHPTLGKRPRVWDGATREYNRQAYEGPDEARFDRVESLQGAVEGGAFDDVLLRAFGDHARVTVRAAGIEVESYDHD